MENVKPKRMSEVGRLAAEVLADTFKGLHHLDVEALRRVDWGNELYVTFNLAHKGMATVDYDELTTLVVLAHDRQLRAAVRGAGADVLQLIFHRRSKRKGLMAGAPFAPGLEEHVGEIRKRCGG